MSTLQSSGPISLSNVALWMGYSGATPYTLSQFYEGRDTPASVVTNKGVPSSGPIALSNFYGAHVNGSNGNCVFIECVLPSGKKAGNAKVGDALVLMNKNGDGMFNYRVTAIRQAMAQCATITTESDISLTCSYTTPIAFRKKKSSKVEFKPLGELGILGRYVPVMDNEKFRWELVTGLKHRGLLPVALLSCDNGVYAAGDQPDRFIFTHNIKE